MTGRKGSNNDGVGGSRPPAVARTKGDLKVTSADGTTHTVTNRKATKAARALVRRDWQNHGGP